MNNREVMQQALEALEVALNDDYNLPYTKIVAAVDALRAALAEPDEFIEDETIYCPTCGEEDGGTTCGMPDCGLRCVAEPEQEPQRKPTARAKLEPWAHVSRVQSDEDTYDFDSTVVDFVVAGDAARRGGQCSSCDRAVVPVAMVDREAGDLGVTCKPGGREQT